MDLQAWNLEKLLSVCFDDKREEGRGCWKNMNRISD